MTLPDICFIRVPQKIGLPVEKEFTAAELAWKKFAPPENQGIAAVAFYFAEQIQQKTGRKVGIIQSSYSGTPCEAWTPEWALDARPELKYLANEVRRGIASGKTKEQWEAESKAFHEYWLANREWIKTKNGPRPVAVPKPGPDNPWDSCAPTGLYENMIVPLLPYTTRGVVWYQGENNAGKPDEYRVLFPAMIEAWRKAGDRPDWPFFFVQLPAYARSGQDYAGMRAAQTFTRDTVKNTGMALAIDCGEKDNIHPRAKQPVGERLARLALDQVYKQDVSSRGPAFQSLEKNNGKVRVVFQYAENGLKTSDGKSEVPGFEIAAKDGKYCTAQACIVGKDTVELTSLEVMAPVSVRYAWHGWIEPPVTLQNSAGLPTEPFNH
jgi:sialate O-acetylesterase